MTRGRTDGWSLGQEEKGGARIWQPPQRQDLWRRHLATSCHAVTSFVAGLGAMIDGVEMCYLGVTRHGADLLGPRMQNISLGVYM